MATATRTTTGGLSLHRVSAATATGLTYLLLIAGSALFALPFYWMVRTSLMAVENIFLYPPQLIPNPIVWGNYAEMWQTGPFLHWLRNSAIVTLTTMVGETFTSMLVAFGFARTRFPGRDKLFVFVLASLMIPYYVVLVPRYILFRDLGWINTLYPLIVPELFGSAFSIFVLRQFFLTLPLDLDEAATVDGAGPWTILWRIVAPLSKPAIATVAVFSFINHWNDFVQPLIYLQTPEALTLAVGIRWFNGRFGTEFHLLMAVSVVALLPIILIFFFAQKQFIQGIALTGVKG
ncbi:MAG: carbohydrate ABC transporter permease [Chloroflexi bacterium]|nr:carbohydrate ABC transporter permease [Chloroflexota bacterium]